jgi:hypothetical protein
VAKEAHDGEEHIKRGPKGGKRHTPGRGHARKSQPSLKKRTSKRLTEKHGRRREEMARREEAFKKLSLELQRLLKPEDLDIRQDES